MSVDSSTSESEDEDYESERSPQPARLYTPAPSGSYPQPSPLRDEYRRSPSIAYSFASPPPESEEDDAVNSPQSQEDTDNEWDADFDDSEEDIDVDADAETQWESPGPRSPSAPIMDTSSLDVVVKQEDPQEALHPWDTFASVVPEESKIAEVLARASSGVYHVEAQGTSEVKTEPFDAWIWDMAYRDSTPDWFARSISTEPDALVQVKQEEFEFEPQFIERDSPSPLSPYSSVSSHSSNFFAAPSQDLLSVRRRSEFVWKDVELLGPEHVNPKEFDELHGSSRPSTVRARAKTSPALSSFSSFQAGLPTETSASSSKHAESPAPEAADQVETASQSIPLSVETLPAELSCATDSESTGAPVIHTCLPCTPAISATQVEGTDLLVAVM